MNATLDSDAPRVPPPAPPLPPPPQPPQQPPPPPPQQPLPPPPATRFDGGGPTVSQVLVGVGALLVVVAVGVFSAVTWSVLGPVGQALVLVGVTVGAGGATVLLARRGLRASAEAVGVVSAALALATFEGARDVLLTGTDPWLAWAFGCGVVASALIGLGHVARVRAPMIVALFLGQWCVPLVLAGSTPPLAVVALALVGLAVADVLVLTAAATRQPEVSVLAGAFGAVAWLASVLVGTVLLFDRPGQAIIPLLLAALAAAAVSVSSHPALRGWWSVAAAAGATVSAVLAAVGVALALGAGDAFWLPVAVVAGGVAVWLPTRSDERLVAVTAVAGASAVLLASADLVRSIAAASGPFFADAWVRLGWSATGHDVVVPGETDGFMGEGDPTLTFLGLVAATGLLVRWPRVAFGVGALTVAAAGGLLDLSVVAIVVVEVVLAVGLCLGYALDRRVPGEAGLIGLGFAFLAPGWALVVAPELVLGALVVMLAAAVAALGAAVEGRFVPAGRREYVLVAGVAVAWLTGVGSALAFGSVMEWETATVWLFTAAAAMVGSLVGFALDTRSASAAVLSDSCAVAGITVAGMIAATFGDAHTLSLVLAGVTVTAIAHTLRPDRFWPAAIIAAGSGVALAWVRLWMADVELVEAYSLPLAAVLGLLGWLVHRRGHAGGSWAITGPALLVATVPSTLLALGSPGEARSLLVIAAAATMIVVGVTLGWKAPLVLGAAIASVVGLAELWPAINRLPRWSVLATLGLTLIMLGARIEEGKKGVARLAGRISSMW